MFEYSDEWWKSLVRLLLFVQVREVVVRCLVAASLPHTHSQPRDSKIDSEIASN